MKSILIDRVCDDDGPFLALIQRGTRYFLVSWVDAWEPRAGERSERAVSFEEGKKMIFVAKEANSWGY